MSFIDYITGGCKLQVCVGIDYSETNGDPRDMRSLHYQSGNDDVLNAYEYAIKAVVEVVSKYDDEKMYPVWGFGARFAGKLQNCFQVGESEVRGVEGVLNSYREVCKWGIEMSSPAVITEVVKMAATYAANTQVRNS